MIFPKPTIVLERNDHDEKVLISEETIKFFRLNQVLCRHNIFCIIDGEKFKCEKPASRYCFKYKNLFYKIEFNEIDYLNQNENEYKNYKRLNDEDKIYFSTVLHFEKDEFVFLGKKINYNYVIHKYENIQIGKTGDNDEFREKIRELALKYSLYDVCYTGWNCGTIERENKTIPFIYDLGV